MHPRAVNVDRTCAFEIRRKPKRDVFGPRSIGLARVSEAKRVIDVTVDLYIRIMKNCCVVARRCARAYRDGNIRRGASKEFRRSI